MDTLLAFSAGYLPLVMVFVVILLAFSLNPDDMHTMLESIGLALPVSIAVAYVIYALHLDLLNGNHLSIHVILTVTLASVAFIFYRKQGFILLVLALLIAISRVMVDAHNPLEVILSIAVAGGVTYGFSRLLPMLRPTNP